MELIKRIEQAGRNDLYIDHLTLGETLWLPDQGEISGKGGRGNQFRSISTMILTPERSSGSED